jgi:hypothetical protein
MAVARESAKVPEMVTFCTIHEWDRMANLE